MTTSRDHIAVFYAMKGGSGTTVTAAIAALATPQESIIVDLAGDMPDVLGCRTPQRTLTTAMCEAASRVDDFDDLLIEVDDHTHLLTTSDRIHLDSVSDTARSKFFAWLERQESSVIVDSGTGTPPALLRQFRTIAVTRPCYLSLMKAARSGEHADGVVVIRENGRALGASDIERAFNAPVVATIDEDPGIARLVDAGLLLTHAHRHGKQLGRIVQPPSTTNALDRWREAKPTRWSPDVDYGMSWTSRAAPERRWRVSWNAGSGDLYAVTEHDEEVIDLGHFTTQEAVDQTIEDWAYLHGRTDGLDKLRARLGATPPTPEGPSIA